MDEAALNRSRLDRLYDQEREERNERRGLEQRALGTMTASLIALGLLVNGLAGTSTTFQPREQVMVIIGGTLTLFGLIALMWILSGAHTNDERSMWRAFMLRPHRPVNLEPCPVTEQDVEDLRKRVDRLTQRNATMVPRVRLATALLGIGAYFAVIGVGVAAL